MIVWSFFIYNLINRNNDKNRYMLSKSLNYYGLEAERNYIIHIQKYLQIHCHTGKVKMFFKKN